MLRLTSSSTTVTALNPDLLRRVLTQAPFRQQSASANSSQGARFGGSARIRGELLAFPDVLLCRFGGVSWVTLRISFFPYAFPIGGRV